MRNIIYISFSLLIGAGSLFYLSQMRSEPSSRYRFQNLNSNLYLKSAQFEIPLNEVLDEHANSLRISWMKRALEILDLKDVKEIKFGLLDSESAQNISCETFSMDCSLYSVSVNNSAQYEISLNGKKQLISDLAKKDFLLTAYKNNETLYRLTQAKKHKFFVEDENILEINDEILFWSEPVDLTHSFRFGPEKGKSFILFCDFFSTYCRTHIPQLIDFFSGQSQWTFYLKTFLTSNDPLETVVGEFFHCLSTYSPNSLEVYFKNLAQMDPKDPEKYLLGELSQTISNLSEVKKCYLNRSTQEILDFNQKTANYHGLQGVPSYFIDKKPFVGPLNIDAIKDFHNWP